MRRIVICGAAGRDFHNFNTLYRDSPSVRVVAFTAAQIPGIDARSYPPMLAGDLYPSGIPIVAESELERVIRSEAVDEVQFAYSDVTHADVMHIASRALACGANFTLAGPTATQLVSRKPVIAIAAVRTGCGKSQVARYLSSRLRSLDHRVAVIRHPMPYGDLARERVQRFASRDDLTRAQCTIEEREEYEPHLEAGTLVFAGVDYSAILEAAEAECDVLIWDGGNNDFPFLSPRLHVVLVDALRPNQLNSHHPGEAVLRMADVVVINKANQVEDGAIAALRNQIKAFAPTAPIIVAGSALSLDPPTKLAGKRLLLVEDGPSLTHGGLQSGAALAAVAHLPSIHIVDPRDSAHPLVAEVFARHPHIGKVLPAVGYNDAQRAALARTIDHAQADIVVSATPIDLAKVLAITKPVVRVRYDYVELEPLSDSALLSEVLSAVSRRQ